MTDPLKRQQTLRIRSNIESDDIYKAIVKISQQDVFRCYQCGDCSSGCPVLEFMDITPTALMKLCQAGDWETILDSRTIFICASCLQCSSRCPKGIDVAAVVEAFREIKLRAGETIRRVQDSPLNRAGKLPPIALVSAFRKYAGV